MKTKEEIIEEVFTPEDIHFLSNNLAYDFGTYFLKIEKALTLQEAELKEIVENGNRI